MLKPVRCRAALGHVFTSSIPARTSSFLTKIPSCPEGGEGVSGTSLSERLFATRVEPAGELDRQACRNDDAKSSLIFVKQCTG